jgi:hypothetical protein
LRYFRNLVEAHAQGFNGNPVEELLGNSHYRTTYQNLLQLIPPEQFHDIDSEYLEGASGRVFFANWQRPPGFLATMRPEDDAEMPKIPVALKQMDPAIDPEKLFQEVQQYLFPLHPLRFAFLTNGSSTSHIPH